MNSHPLKATTSIISEFPYVKEKIFVFHSLDGNCFSLPRCPAVTPSIMRSARQLRASIYCQSKRKSRSLEAALIEIFSHSYTLHSWNGRNNKHEKVFCQLPLHSVIQESRAVYPTTKPQGVDGRSCVATTPFTSILLFVHCWDKLANSRIQSYATQSVICNAA